MRKFQHGVIQMRKHLVCISMSLALAACGTVSPDEAKQYAQIISRVSGDTGSNLDTSQRARDYEFAANIAEINGKIQFPAKSSVLLAPGSYMIRLGIGCGSTSSCHMSRPYQLTVEAGKRYVLTPEKILLSDGLTPRNQGAETVYQSAPTLAEVDLQKQRAIQSEILKQERERASEVWRNRLTAKYSIGDRVCTADNLFGNIEAMTADKFKVYVIGKVSYPSNAFFSVVRFQGPYEKIEAPRWLDRIEVAHCSFNPS